MHRHGMALARQVTAILETSVRANSTQGRIVGLHTDISTMWCEPTSYRTE